MMFLVGFFIGGLLMSRYTIWILNKNKKQESTKTSAEFVSDYLDDMDMKMECVDIFASPATPGAYISLRQRGVVDDNGKVVLDENCELKMSKVTPGVRMKFEIPTHDPQTGELNPHYEELTGNKNPLKD